jgi:hypothetical protein
MVYTSFTLILAFIESIRIKVVHGKVLNVKKVWSVAGAIAAFIITVAIFSQWDWYVLCLAFACIGVRGIFYDPALNLFRGEYIDYESQSTNSKADKAERRNGVNFWQQRLIYLGIALTGYGLFIISHLIFE